MASPHVWYEGKETPEDLARLLERFLRLQTRPPTYAFRGLPCREWQLSSTLNRSTNAKHDDAALRSEREFVEEFRKKAWRFLGSIERIYLGVTDIDKSDPTESALEWKKPGIWAALAIARHDGVPTRLLDWTNSTWIAAYFAACEIPEKDGVVWWFDQSAFERIVHEKWDSFGVTEINDNDQRAMERHAFGDNATEWISKIHHGVPFRRMEVQRGFFTACGRLDKLHDEAIDELDAANAIPRGRVIVPASLKKPLLDTLERMGIHAHAIDFPGADIIGQKLGSGVDARGNDVQD
jgi:hypothetical protein